MEKVSQYGVVLMESIMLFLNTPPKYKSTWRKE